ncbi:MAG: hypothetical protein ACYC67_21385 [Prosthecobacter sp.]
MEELTGFFGWDSYTLLLLAVFGGMEGALNFGKGMKEQWNVPEWLLGFIAEAEVRVSQAEFGAGVFNH